MSTLDLINRLKTEGIALRVEDGKLKVKAEKGALTDALKTEIGANKQAIIDLLGSAREDDDRPQLKRASREGDLPASFAQQRLWFLDALEPGTSLYNMPFASRIQGTPDVGLLNDCLNMMAERHEILRTSFTSVNGQPVQRVASASNLQLEQIDSRNSDPGKTLNELAEASFNLSTAPLLKATLIQTGHDNFILMLVFHHIIADLWSIDVFLKELSALYAAKVAGTAAVLAPLDVQYGDYAVWQRELLSGTRLKHHLQFWSHRLTGAPEVLELPKDHPRPAEPSYNGRYTERALDAALTAQLKTLAREQNATPFMVLLAAFNVLLARYTGEQDILVGTPVSGRNQQALEKLVGFFMNTLVVRTEAEPQLPFSELLNNIRNETLAIRQHEDLPFERLVEELQPERDMSISPVFQVMFVWQEQAERRIDLPGLTIDAAEIVGHDTAKFDLSLFVADRGEELGIGFEYATDLFADASIEHMLDHFFTLLAGIANNPQAAIVDLPLLEENERLHQIDNLSGSNAAYEELPVHKLIERQVEATPDAPALQDGDTTLSYRELNTRANRLAQHLLQEGLPTREPVAVCGQRSAATAIAALAVIKAGGNYVPLDPGYPAERLTYMVKDCAPGWLLTDNNLITKHAGVPADTKVLRLDEFDFNSGQTNNPDISLPVESPLYTIYTSGSTGLPKGVVLPQSTISNLGQWQANDERLGQPARTLQFAPASFDVHVQELFTTWMSGGSLVLVDGDTRRDIPALARFINEQNIERVYLPFAALRPLAETAIDQNLNLPLGDVVSAGEQLQITPAIRELFTSMPDARLHNQYGPSESHVVTALTLPENPADWPLLPSIGDAVPNCRVYVLDTNQQPVPLGAVGELVLGGVQIALGYLNREDLTAEKFLPDKLGRGNLLYRTGDQVRFNAEGELEFLGRIDDQVKFRGFRIEPGEIAARLSNHADVQQAVVLLREDLPGIPQLVGYVVAADSDALQAQLKDRLKEDLPEYMVPAAIICMDSFPLTPSGKVNTRGLPAPDMSTVAGEQYVAPTNEYEEALCGAWSEALGLERVGIHDDFFALGGHSLLATQLLSRVRDALGLDVPLKQLFRHPTPAELGRVVAALKLATADIADVAADDDIEEFSL